MEVFVRIELLPLGFYSRMKEKHTNGDRNSKIVIGLMERVLRDAYLHRCMYDSVSWNWNRIVILEDILLTYDKVSTEQLQEKVYQYGILIDEEELLARQIFLGLNVLVKRQKRVKSE